MSDFPGAAPPRKGRKLLTASVGVATLKFVGLVSPAGCYSANFIYFPPPFCLPDGGSPTKQRCQNMIEPTVVLYDGGTVDSGPDDSDTTDGSIADAGPTDAGSATTSSDGGGDGGEAQDVDAGDAN